MRTLSLLALALCSGCMTTNTGKKVEYTRGQVIELESVDGARVKGQLQHLELDARLGLLQGALVGGRRFSLDPNSLLSTRISTVSPWRTVLLVACILTGAVTAAYGVAGVVILASGGLHFGL